MHLPSIWGLAACLSLACTSVHSAVIPIPAEKRDADFESVKTRLIRDHSGRKGDHPDKYFHESLFHPHYDGRFADKPVKYNEKRLHLTALVKTYLSTMNDIGAETWIMHGSLLGWWWNRKIMPWDTDLDVMMSEKSMFHLANYYNMTIHHFKLPDSDEGRDYMLEVNPHCFNGSLKDSLNKIDARWIDMETGLFIDITSLRRNATAEAEGKAGAMMSKDNHHYMHDDIYPLRETMFEDTPAKVPYAYSDLLLEEYGPDALTLKDFQNHHFDQERMEWIPLRNPDLPPMRKPGVKNTQPGFQNVPQPAFKRPKPKVSQKPERPTSDQVR